jgi:hypothetical protein
MIRVPYDKKEGHRGVIRRAAQELSRRATEFLDWTEECVFYFDADGLGLRVGIRSIRARQIFEALQRSIFRGFEPHAFRYEDGMVWARFGYY